MSDGSSSWWTLQDYHKKLLEHREIDGHLKELREQLKELAKQYEKSENDLKALQSFGRLWVKCLSN